MKHSLSVVILMILVAGMVMAAGNNEVALDQLRDVTDWMRFGWDENDLPTKFVDIPDDLPQAVHRELATSHPNRGMRQQYSLTYAGRYPSDTSAPYRLFDAARDAALKTNSYTDPNERAYLFGDQRLILELASEWFQGTRHGVTALFFIGFNKLERQLRLDADKIDVSEVEDAIRLFYEVLELPNAALSDNVFRTAMGGLAYYPNPSHPASLYNIARAYELIGRWEQALWHYQRILDAFPNESLAVEAAARIIIFRDLNQK